MIRRASRGAAIERGARFLSVLLLSALVGCSTRAPVHSEVGEVENERLVRASPGGTDLPVAQRPEITGRYRCGEFARCDFSEFMAQARVCALVVVKDGQIVYEDYAPPGSPRCRPDRDSAENGPDRPYGLASIAKSVTSTLLGMMIASNEYGAIDLNAAVGLYETRLQGDAAAVRLGHALGMRSGLAWDDSHETLRDMTVSDPTHSGFTFREAADMLARRDDDAIPGDTYNYSGLDTTLLALVIERKLADNSGDDLIHLDEALTRWLWQPLAMKGDAYWKADKAGTPSPYCCFKMRARDLAKFGQYILENALAAGDGPGTPIAEWISRGTRFYRSESGRCFLFGEGYRLGYGYQWWPFENARYGFTGIGTGGQLLHIVPQDRVVIVQFSDMPDAEERMLECHSYDAHRVILEAVRD